MATVEGVDYAFTPHPRPSELVRAGKRFAVRYGGPGSGTKLITVAEAHALADAGLWLVANAEQSQKSALNGYAMGVTHAKSALAAFGACGMPSDRPIYYSLDWDAQQSDWAQVTAYFKGIHSVHGVARTGVYGSRWAMLWAQRDDLAKWFWQCTAATAWSGGTGGQLAPFAHLAQYHNGVPIDGADCDLDRAMKADYGQWKPGISGGDDMSWSETFANPSAPGSTATAADFLRYANAYAFEANKKLDTLAAEVAELKEALTAIPASTSPTLDAESLAAAMRAVIRDELNKSHLQG